LKQLEWKPADGRQRALYAILRGDHAGAAVEGEAAVGPLVSALAGKEASGRRAAAAALGKTGDRRAIEPLLGALSDHDETVRGAAVKAVAVFGATALVPLARLVEEATGSLEAAARQALAAIGDAPGVAAALAAAVAAGTPFREEGKDFTGITDEEEAERARTAAATLRLVLVHASEKIPAAELEAIAALPDVALIREPREPRVQRVLDEEVGCGGLRSLARAALAKSGRPR
jgi:HEAT repeat protein